jgi:hypothetical protein
MTPDVIDWLLLCFMLLAAVVELSAGVVAV